jgi:hypothetical protein
MLLPFVASCAPGQPAGTAEGPYPAGSSSVDGEAGKDILTPLPPSNAPVPAAGSAALSGALYSYTIQRVIPQTMFYLTPAQGAAHDAMPAFLIGPAAANGDIVAYSDAQGNFQLDSIPPGNYFLVVSAPYSWSPAETSPDDPTPLLIRLNVGDRVALGVVYLSWP